MGVLIQLEDISKVYPMPSGDVHALRGVSLEFEAGEFVSITGPSGSGKTTLLYLLGLLTTPSGGVHRFGGRAVEDLSDGELSAVRGREVGFIFQSFNLLAQLSVLDNVMLAARYARGVDGEFSRRQACELIERVGLSSRIDHRPRELSGGELQRVAVARALLTRPNLILADEPTGNLDEANGDQIFELLRSLAEEGRTVIVVTHDLAMARRTHRQIKLKDGRTIDEAA